MNAEPPREDAMTLEILDVIEKKEDVTQRHLARHLGVALGLANSYLKRCIRKGYIKVTTAPANRYLYYLTPKGFAEKSRLTSEYLSVSFSFYRRAGESCRRSLDRCRSNGWRRLVLCGLSDLAEIATVRAGEYPEIEIVGYYEPAIAPAQFLGRPVWPQLLDASRYDACLLTALTEPRAQYDALCTVVPADRIVVPDLLRLERPG